MTALPPPNSIRSTPIHAAGNTGDATGIPAIGGPTPTVTPTTGSNVTEVIFDPQTQSNPYFLHVNENPALELVSSPLDGSNDHPWARAMSMALRKPYVIPVGGSNSLGTWGYIEAIREIEQQLQHTAFEQKFDDILVACGSGGTIAGLSIGSWLSSLKAKVNAFCVCDDPEYFYEYVVQDLLDGLNAGISSHDIVNIQNGLGYAMNTSEELKFVKEIAQTTGVILDPVYSGKAAYGMMKDMVENPKKWEGRKILFIHTGGLLGLFDKSEQMASLVGNWRKMDIHESVPRRDGTDKMF